MILTKPQAEAVYSAMCALNNVGVVRMEATLPGEDKEKRRVYARVRLQGNAVEVVGHGWFDDHRETFVSQHEFANCYGLVG